MRGGEPSESTAMYRSMRAKTSVTGHVARRVLTAASNAAPARCRRAHHRLHSNRLAAPRPPARHLRPHQVRASPPRRVSRLPPLAPPSVAHRHNIRFHHSSEACRRTARASSDGTGCLRTYRNLCALFSNIRNLDLRPCPRGASDVPPTVRHLTLRDGPAWRELPSAEVTRNTGPILRPSRRTAVARLRGIAHETVAQSPARGRVGARRGHSLPRTRYPDPPPAAQCGVKDLSNCKRSGRTLWRSFARTRRKSLRFEATAMMAPLTPRLAAVPTAH